MNKQNPYTFARDGNILISKVVGTISLKDIERAFIQLKVEVRQFSGAPWANLIDTRQWGLNAVDIDETLIEIEAWVKKHRRTHRVFVIGTEYAEIKKFALEKYWGNTVNPEEFKLVETKSEALTWLAQCGFHLDSAQNP